MKRYIRSSRAYSASALELDAAAHSEFETNGANFRTSLINDIADNPNTSEATLKYLCKQADKYYAEGGDIVACTIAMRNDCSPDILSSLYELFVKYDNPSILLYISTNPNVPIHVLKQMKDDNDFWFITSNVTRRPETIKKELNHKLRKAGYR